MIEKEAGWENDRDGGAILSEYNIRQMAKYIDQLIDQVNTQQEQIKALEATISLSPDYVKEDI